MFPASRGGGTVRPGAGAPSLHRVIPPHPAPPRPASHPPRIRIASASHRIASHPPRIASASHPHRIASHRIASHPPRIRLALHPPCIASALHPPCIASALHPHRFASQPCVHGARDPDGRLRRARRRLGAGLHHVRGLGPGVPVVSGGSCSRARSPIPFGSVRLSFPFGGTFICFSRSTVFPGQPQGSSRRTVYGVACSQGPRQGVPEVPCFFYLRPFVPWLLVSNGMSVEAEAESGPVPLRPLFMLLLSFFRKSCAWMDAWGQEG